jgi:hypothetical protein
VELPDPPGRQHRLRGLEHGAGIGDQPPARLDEHAQRLARVAAEVESGQHRCWEHRMANQATISTVPAPHPYPRRWRTLGLLGVAQLMLILDVTVVAVALPNISADLGLSRQLLTWVVSGIGMWVAASVDGTVAMVAGITLGAAGTGAVFVAAAATALGQVGPTEAGLASGIVSTFHEFGAALGAAVVSSIAAASLAGADTAGFSRAFATAAVVAAAAALVTLAVAPGRQAPASTP